MICPLKIKKAKILIKVSKNLCYQNHYHGKYHSENFILSHYNRSLYARHDGANIKIYIITLSKDTYTLISRVMSLGYEGGRYVLTQLGWNF